MTDDWMDLSVRELLAHDSVKVALALVLTVFALLLINAMAGGKRG